MRNSHGPFMPQSLANILVHVVFSTKGRMVWIADDWREDLHAYIGGIIRRHDSVLLAAGSVEDHIHLLFPLPRIVSFSDLVREIKSGSARWVHESPTRPAKFRWQSGYGAFSISPSHKAALCRYIANQRGHHTKVTFQDEFRILLEKYGVDHDERYVWD
jgi:REP element-mobilizing transposase RayT